MIKRRRPAAAAVEASKRPSPLQAARSFVVPRPVMDSTLEVLQRAGEHGCEAFVVWGAIIDEGTVMFTSMLMPEQTAHRTEDGLLVTVDGDALFEVNKTLYERGQVLAAQVHSHPTEAYHSDTDDCFSLVTLAGAISLVIPDFGSGGIDAAAGWAWYRLVGEGTWVLLTADDHVSIVEVAE